MLYIYGFYIVMYTRAHAKNTTGKFEFSLTFARLTFPNIDAWAIEGICKPVHYSNACKERASKASSLLVHLYIYILISLVSKVTRSIYDFP